MKCKHKFKPGIAFNSLRRPEYTCIPSEVIEYFEYGVELINVEKCINCGYSIKLENYKPIAEQILEYKLTPPSWY